MGNNADLRSVSNDDETLSRELGVNAIVGHKKEISLIYGGRGASFDADDFGPTFLDISASIWSNSLIFQDCRNYKSSWMVRQLINFIGPAKKFGLVRRGT
jgi:hypothetical protein